jgi:hypothetical protein
MNTAQCQLQMDALLLMQSVCGAEGPTDVVALAVFGRGIVYAEEEGDQVRVRHFVGVKDEVHRLSVPRRPRAHLRVTEWPVPLSRVRALAWQLTSRLPKRRGVSPCHHCPKSTRPQLLVCLPEAVESWRTQHLGLPDIHSKGFAGVGVRLPCRSAPRRCA